jgi:putative flippase GtrA
MTRSSSPIRWLVRPGKFAVVGVVNTAIDFVIFTALVSGASWPPVLANVVSYSCAVANSFLLNKHWTFSEKRGQGRAIRQFVLFAGCNLVGLILSTTIVWALAQPLGALAAKAVSIVATFAWNYWTSRQLVFALR